MANEDVSLTLVRNINAPVSKVYAAWIDPAVAAKWFAPGDMTATAQFDAKVGGCYRVEMKEPSGETHVVGGEYRELTPNRRLVKTWRWEGSETETLVTVEFAEKAGRTEMTLRHERFGDAETRDKHNQGWTGCLTKLEKLFAGEAVAA